MSKNIIEIALKAGFINTSNGLESPFIEGEDLTDNLKLFASLLLAQPEEEGVYQKLLRIEDGIEVEILPSELWFDGYEAGKRSMQPEQEPVAWMQDDIELYVQESKDTIRGYVIPLYTTPVNKNIESLKAFLKKKCIRMPLSEYEITEECDSKGQEHISAFIDGIEFAEKMHGIGGEE